MVTLKIASAAVAAVTASLASLAAASIEVKLMKNVDNPLIDFNDLRYNATDRFESWKQHYGKVYSTTFEHEKASKAWNFNDKFAKEHNAKGLSFTVAHNSFSDLMWDEFKERYTGIKDKDSYLGRPKNYVTYKGDDLADSVDWVDEGAVTDVKDQGNCGS